MTLETFFHENSRVALAFSGGVDSAYLLYAARACGAQVRAYYVQTAFQPAFEREDALRLARELGEPRGLTLADPEAFRLAAAAWDWGDGMSCAEYWRRA